MSLADIRLHLAPALRLKTALVAFASGLIVLELLWAVVILPLRDPPTVITFGDFRAFYCAARVAREGFDPYRIEPLGACERGLAGLTGSNFSLPAPLPGHAIGLLEPLTLLPFVPAFLMWCTLLTAMFFATSVLLARLTGWPYVYAFFACLPLGFLMPLALGQIAPLAIALVVIAAAALAAGRITLAAWCAAFATLEPHIGLPVCVALFVARPAARAPLAIAAAALALLALAVSGPAGVHEYLGRVLPEHLAAEARYDDQYSLTYALTWLGMRSDSALILGQVSFWFLAIASIVAAIGLAARTSNVLYLLFVPLAGSVIGGPFVHIEHVFAAVPLAIVLTTRGAGAPVWRAAASTALILIACPAMLLVRMARTPGIRLPIADGPMPVASSLAPTLAQAGWAARIAPNSGHVGSLLIKFPTWAGLGLLVALVVFLLVAQRPPAAVTKPVT